MVKILRFFLPAAIFILMVGVNLVLAHELGPRQKLILQVPEGHRLEGLMTLTGDKEQSRVTWKVGHTSDFGPVEVTELTQTGAKLLIFSHGEQLKGLVVFVGFSGPYVPMFSGKFDENGNMYEVKKEGQKELSAEGLKELSALALPAIREILSFFQISSDEELATYIKTQKFRNNIPH